MLKTFKDIRRRSVETILATVGSTETTHDEDYDTHVAKFHHMENDMNECGAELHAFLSTQKTLFSDAKELATSLARIYDSNLNMTDWPDVHCELKHSTVAYQYKDKWTSINDVLRSSTAMVASEQALEPLKSAVTKMGPEIDALCKEREIRKTDYDSYRRRLKEKEQKKESLVTQGKGSTQAAIDLDAEIEKFRGKVQAGLEAYTFQNDKTKNEIISAKKAHDNLMDITLITTLVCQAELFAQSAAQLEELLSELPEAKVKQVRQRVRDYIVQGGIKPVTEEKTKFQKSMAVLTGKNVMSDFEKTPEQVEADNREKAIEQKKAAAIVESTQPRVASKANPFGDEEDTNKLPVAKPVAPTGPPPAPTGAPKAANPPPPAAPQEPKKVWVEALFDHVAEEEDELSFSVGDKVEVLETGDGGWWKGRAHGKEGLFPVNYVKTL